MKDKWEQMEKGTFRHTIGLDFDGVIMHYPGWCNVVNEPIPGALNAIRRIHQQFNIFIHCARSPVKDHPGGLYAIPTWFEKHELGIPTYVDEEYAGYFWNNSRAILVTNRKFPAKAYVDDRGIRFENWDQALADMAALCDFHF